MHKMSSNDIVIGIETILAEDLEIKPQGLTAQTRLEDIANLDSFGVITLFMSIEATFGVQFTTDQITSMKTVGDIIDRISAAQNES